MHYQFIHRSGNAKTGPIPTTNHPRATCPTTCPLKDDGGCYGENYLTGHNWNLIDQGKRGGTYAAMLDKISALPQDQLWRGCVVGDQCHNNGVINSNAYRLIEANHGKRGFTYSHHLPTLKNRGFFTRANREGFTVNLSANGLTHADQLADLEIAPVVSIMPANAPKVSFTPKGRKVVRCPAVNADHVTCKNCQLCQEQRNIIIGFPAHGTRKRRVEVLFN